MCFTWLGQFFLYILYTALHVLWYLIEAEGVDGGLFNPTCPGGTWMWLKVCLEVCLILHVLTVPWLRLKVSMEVCLTLHVLAVPDWGWRCVFGGLFSPTCPGGTWLRLKVWIEVCFNSTWYLIQAAGVDGGLFDPTCPGGPWLRLKVSMEVCLTLHVLVPYSGCRCGLRSV
jgi:hypothetical protein